MAIALSVEAKGLGRDVAYSRDRSFYASGNDLYGYIPILDQVKHFTDAGWIRHWKQAPNVRKMQSVIRPNPEFVRTVDEVLARGPRLSVEQPRDTIVLRVNGVKQRAPDTQGLNRDRRQIERLNEMLSSLDYSLGTSSLTQVYVGDMKSCGRLIATGGAWQNVPTEERLASTINGRPLVELDFKNVHPVMLYDMVGIPPPSDSYDIDGHDRKLVKTAFNTLVNASSWQEAVGAVQHSKRMRAFHDPQSREARALAVVVLMAVKARHVPISRFFLTGIGMALMYRESRIAMDVMTTLERQGVPALPVHDAFLVDRANRDLLLTTMREAADRAGLSRMVIEEHLPKVENGSDYEGPAATNNIETIQSVKRNSSDIGEGVVSGMVGLDAIPYFDSQTARRDSSERSEGGLLDTAGVPTNQSLESLISEIDYYSTKPKGSIQTVSDISTAVSMLDSESPTTVNPVANPDTFTSRTSDHPVIAVLTRQKPESLKTESDTFDPSPDPCIGIDSEPSSPVSLPKPETSFSVDPVTSQTGPVTLVSGPIIIPSSIIPDSDLASPDATPLTIIRPAASAKARPMPLGFRPKIPTSIKTVEPAPVAAVARDLRTPPPFVAPRRVVLTGPRYPEGRTSMPGPPVPQCVRVDPSQGTLAVLDATGLGWRQLYVAKDGSGWADMWFPLGPEYPDWRQLGMMKAFLHREVTLRLVNVTDDLTEHRFFGDAERRVDAFLERALFVFEGEYDPTVDLAENLCRKAAAKKARLKRESSVVEDFTDFRVPDDLWTKPFGAAKDLKNRAAKANRGRSVDASEGLF